MMPSAMRPPSSGPGRWPAALAALAALTVLAVHLPALGNGFVNWDDPAMIPDNPHIRSLGWDLLRWAVTTSYMSAYQPLGWIGYAVIHRLQGPAPFGFHLASILVHAASSGLFLLIARRILSRALAPIGTRWILAGSACSALLFGLHPTQVETVACAAGFADLLAVLFFMASLSAYLESVEAAGSRRAWLAVSLAAFVLSGLSRWKGIHLPVVVAVLNAWPLRRWGRDSRVPAEAGAFAVIAAAAAGANALAKSAGAGYEVGLRAAEGGFGALFYLWKLLWPADLVPVLDLSALARGPSGLLALAACILLTVLLVMERRRLPAALAAWLCWLAAIAPPFAMGIRGPALAQYVHSYAACAAVFLLAGGGAAVLLDRRRDRLSRAAAGLVALAVLACLAGATLRQIGVWKDSVSLWTHTLAVDDSSMVARTNLAMGLAEQGRFDEALLHLREQLRRFPNDALSRGDLDYVLSRRGPSSPDLAACHSNAGADLYRLGRFDEALWRFGSSLALDPKRADVHANAAVLLRRLDRPQSEQHRRFGVRP